MILDLVHRIKRKWIKIRLQPIRVFCFHQVSETFDASTMYPEDWTQIDQFKRNIEQLKKQYTFISLPEAYDKLKHDTYRLRKYAVLTSDDGWASLENIIPWLAEQHIPITLFVNPAYLNGEESRENNMEGVLIWNELDKLLDTNSNITIASHGWNHILACDMSVDEFNESVLKAHRYLEKSDRYIHFYAYPCGSHNNQHNMHLNSIGIVPVYIDGLKNYTFDGGIHRELLDGVIVNSEK